jgi:hypothetical protein
MITTIKSSVLGMAFVLLLLAVPYTSHAASVDLTINGSDAVLTLSKKEKVTAVWTANGVKNCHLYVAGGNSRKVKTSGEKKLSVSPKAAYVTVSCNSIETGEEISDRITVSKRSGAGKSFEIATPSCTVEAKPYMPAVGERFKLSWATMNATKVWWEQNSAANVFGLPAKNLSKKGTKKFEAAGKGEQTVTLFVSNKDQSDSCSTKVIVEQ